MEPRLPGQTVQVIFSRLLGGLVWQDDDYDTQVGGSEQPLANVPLTLIPQGTTSGPTRITVTGADGTYQFPSVAAGEYLLQVQDANLNAARGLYPTDSSLYFATLEICEEDEKSFGYAPSQEPVLGDFVWYDVNRNGLQDEWYDANGDGQVTKNDPEQNLDMTTWEWLDLNGDDSYLGPENEGELYKCGVGQAVATGNVWVTNTNTREVEKVIVSIWGYWRERPGYGAYQGALNLTDDNGALTAAAAAMAATGQCKPLPGAPAAPQSRTRTGITTRATAAGDPALTCAATNSPTEDVGLTDPGHGNPVPERLDLDFGLICGAAGTDIFDPPSGFKTVDAQGNPLYRWRMVWINGGNLVANAVRIVDPIPTGTEYVTDSLNCEARGASQETTCAYQAADNQVVWEGRIAPDFGAQDEESASHEVVIEFDTRRLDGAGDPENIADAYWDADGSGDVDDDMSQGQTPVQTNDGVVTRAGTVRLIPLLPGPALALLAFGLLGLGIWQTHRRPRRH